MSGLRIFGVSVHYDSGSADFERYDTDCCVMVNGIRYSTEIKKFIGVPKLSVVKVYNKRSGLSANFVNGLIILNVRNSHYFIDQLNDQRARGPGQQGH